MSSISVFSSNATLSYSSGGQISQTRVRCNILSFNYTLNSTESHARQHKAFYPHRRSQGDFQLSFECNGWSEFNELSNWFKEYAKAVLDLSLNDVPPPMTVSVPSRNFLRLGIPTTGIEFGDHLASMVFRPAIVFKSVSDPADTSTSILSRSQASTMKLRGNDPTVASFYPQTVIRRPGSLGDQLYAPPDPIILSAQQLADLITNNHRQVSN